MCRKVMFKGQFIPITNKGIFDFSSVFIAENPTYKFMYQI